MSWWLKASSIKKLVYYSLAAFSAQWLEGVDARPNDECSPAALSHSPPLDHEDGVPQSVCTITQPNAKNDKHGSTHGLWLNLYGLEALKQLEDGNLER